MEISKTPDIDVCCPLVGEYCVTLDASTVVKNNPDPFPTKPKYFYNWTQNPGNGNSIGNTASIKVCPTKSTQYIVTVTDVNNCTNADTINVYFRGPLSVEIIDQSTCCIRAYKAVVRESPCSTVDAINNNSYPYVLNWTTNGQVISNNSVYNPPSSGGVYNVNVSNACHTAVSTVNVNLNLVRTLSNNVPVIAFDQQVFSGNPMPIYHYDPIGHSSNPIFWFGSPAYNAYGYRIEVYYRWDATSFQTAPAQLARVYETSGCNTMSNGDIKIDGINSSGNYMQPGGYLFRIWLKDCDGNLYPVNKLYRRRLVCNGYTTYWLNAACGYCVIPTKICTNSSYIDEVVDGSGFNHEVFNFFNF